MINLLPSNNLSVLKKEYLNRVVTVGVVLTAVVVVIVLVVSTTIFLVLSLKEKSLVRELGGVPTENKSENFEQVSSYVTGLNTNISIINSLNNKISLQAVLDLIMAYKIDGIRIQSPNFDNSGSENQGVTIKGQFTSRKVFLDYVEKLKQSTQVVSVNSPVDNLIKEKAGSFSLELKLKTNQL